jgi:hypothetical protein
MDLLGSAAPHGFMGQPYGRKRIAGAHGTTQCGVTTAAVNPKCTDCNSYVMNLLFLHDILPLTQGESSPAEGISALPRPMP